MNIDVSIIRADLRPRAPFDALISKPFSFEEFRGLADSLIQSRPPATMASDVN
jgi:hypothetical protein